MLQEAPKRMTPEEIRELMELTFAGSTTKMAYALDMTAAGVQCWLDGTRCPRGPASVLMRLWLIEAREKSNGTTSRRVKTTPRP